MVEEIYVPLKSTNPKPKIVSDDLKREFFCLIIWTWNLKIKNVGTYPLTLWIVLKFFAIPTALLLDMSIGLSIILFLKGVEAFTEMLKTAFSKMLKFALILITIAILPFMGLSFLNYATSGKYPWLQQKDIFTKTLVSKKFTDVTEMFTASEKIRDTTKYIVVHCDAIDKGIYNKLPAFDIETYHKKKGYKHFAYHLYISRAGETYQMHELNEATNHVGKTINPVSISVCLEGNFDHEKLEAAQAKSLLFTLIELQRKYPYAMVIGHCDVSNKSCPGKNVNIKEIKESLNIHALDLFF